MTQWRKDIEWLQEPSYASLQQALLNLDVAFTRFFKDHSKFPKFKKKQTGGSARFTKANFKIKNKKLFLAKIRAPIGVVWSQELPSKRSSCTISLTPSGQWFVSFVCEEEISHLSKSGKQIGIDLGIETFATFSDGTKIKQPDSIRKMRRKLARAQRDHSRKKVGSKNRGKARVKLARSHQKIVNIRTDFLQKLSTQIIRENQTIAIESLIVDKMREKGKRRLSRLIGEQGWYSFRRMLEYKADWYGREIIVVDKYFPSSQICNSCGKTNKLSLDKRKFTCECGVTYDRDVNAAQNILAVGTTVSACGTNVRLPSIQKWLVSKQEVLPEMAG